MALYVAQNKYHLLGGAEPGGRHRSATYLPEVAGHEGWSQEETLQTLVRKAGYKGTLQSVLPTLKVISSVLLRVLPILAQVGHVDTLPHTSGTPASLTVLALVQVPLTGEANQSMRSSAKY